jgi:hypothetical protein
MGKSNGKSGSARNGAAAQAAWSDQVAHLMQREGMSREKARDKVILDQLRGGEIAALAELLLEGHVPAPNVRFALALMLLENDAAEAAIARHHADPASLWLPHRFTLRSRPAEPRVSRSAVAGGGQGKSAPVMHDLGYEAAIARLDQAILAGDAPKTAAAVSRPAQRSTPSKRKR